MLDAHELYDPFDVVGDAGGVCAQPPSEEHRGKDDADDAARRCDGLHRLVGDVAAMFVHALEARVGAEQRFGRHRSNIEEASVVHVGHIDDQAATLQLCDHLASVAREPVALVRAHTEAIRGSAATPQMHQRHVGCTSLHQRVDALKFSVEHMGTLDPRRGQRSAVGLATLEPTGRRHGTPQVTVRNKPVVDVKLPVALRPGALVFEVPRMDAERRSAVAGLAHAGQVAVPHDGLAAESSPVALADIISKKTHSQEAVDMQVEESHLSD